PLMPHLRPLLALLLIPPLALPPTAMASTTSKDEDARIIHTLNRLAYGARPGDLESVRKMGLSRWIDLQLHPTAIPDPDATARLKPLRTAALSSRDLLKAYELP